MKLQHHLGGLEGIGPIEFQKRVFVEEWEKRIFGIHVAMMGLSNHLGAAIPKYAIADVPTQFKGFWTWGHLRSGAEAMNPFDYFRFRYYEKWLGGISGYFVSEGYVTEAELDARTALYLQDGNLNQASLPAKANDAIDDQVVRYLREGDSPRHERSAPPKFSVGQKVRMKDIPPKDHTRLPGHLRGRVGTVTEVYKDAYAYFFETGDGIGPPMPCYAVAFRPEDLWGPAKSDPKSVVYADIFEAYMVAA